MEIPTGAINTRGWFYYIPANGQPEKIVHGVESGALNTLPGRSFVYASQYELRSCLKRYSGLKVAVQYSQDLAIISYLDHGTALNLKQAGVSLASSATLVQRIESLFDKAMIASHETAARHLYEIVDVVWTRIKTDFSQTELREGDVQSWILDEFTERGLETDHPPIVAAGAHSADPHYAPQDGGAPLKRSEVLQLDLWAKVPGSVFADISWVGFLDTNVPPEIDEAFSAIVSARDGSIDLINSKLAEHRQVTGKEVDLHARRIIEEHGFARFIKHRTGHSIDTECHGSGVNLDSVEFPDSRRLLEGSCFSVEPGVYLSSFGLRTEIDAYISDGKAVVSGNKPQSRILTLQE